MQAFEVSHLRLIAGFNQRFISRGHEGAQSAAKHRLLAKEIGFGLLAETGFEDAGAGSANAVRPGQRDFAGLLAGVLIDADQGRNAFAFEVLPANDMAGTFGGDEDHVHSFGRNDRFEMDGEAVRKEQRFSLG